MASWEKPRPGHRATADGLGKWEVTEEEVKRKQDRKPRKKSSESDTVV